MTEVWANNAASTLASGITSGATSLTVQTGHGARFPAPSSPDYFWVTLEEGTTIEVCKCTARSGDVLTVVRGQQGTTAAAFNAGAKVENRLTRDTLQDLQVGRVQVTWPAGGFTQVVQVVNDARVTPSSRIIPRASYDQATWPQIAKPISTIDPLSADTTEHHFLWGIEPIDETFTSFSIPNATTNWGEWKLQGVWDPLSSVLHKIKARWRLDQTAPASVLTVKLLEGATQRAIITPAISTTFVTTELLLSAAEADAIVDYNNLRVEVRLVNNEGTARILYVSWVQGLFPSRVHEYADPGVYFDPVAARVRSGAWDLILTAQEFGGGEWVEPVPASVVVNVDYRLG